MHKNLFARLLFVIAVAITQSANAFDTKPPFFDDVCTHTRFNYDKCLRAVSGTTQMYIWMSTHLKTNPKPSTKLIIGEETTTDDHARNQTRIAKINAVGRVSLIAHGLYSRKLLEYYEEDLEPGQIMSLAGAPIFREGERHLYTLRVGALVVAPTGNDGAKKPEQTITGDDLRSPFTLLAGGYGLRRWLICRKNEDDKSCEFNRSDSSNHCSGGEKICILGTFDIVRETKTSFSFGGEGTGSGTSIATGHISGVVELLTQFLQHYPFAFRERLSDVQALILATALVKSCAVDMGKDGIDAETGLGRLSLECMNDADHPGKFHQNPMALIKPDFLIVPPQFATTPVMAETEATTMVYPMSATRVRVVAESEAEYAWVGRKSRADVVSRLSIDGEASTLMTSFAEDVPFSSTGRFSSTVSVSFESKRGKRDTVLYLRKPMMQSTGAIKFDSFDVRLSLASSLGSESVMSTLTADVMRMRDQTGPPDVIESEVASTASVLSKNKAQIVAGSRSEYATKRREHKSSVVSSFEIGGVLSTITVSFEEEIPTSKDGEFSSIVCVTVERKGKINEKISCVDISKTSIEGVKVGDLKIDLKLGFEQDEKSVVSKLTVNIRKALIRLKIKVYLEGALPRCGTECLNAPQPIPSRRLN